MGEKCSFISAYMKLLLEPVLKPHSSISSREEKQRLVLRDTIGTIAIYDQAVNVRIIYTCYKRAESQISPSFLPDTILKCIIFNSASPHIFSNVCGIVSCLATLTAMQCCRSPAHIANNAILVLGALPSSHML